MRFIIDNDIIFCNFKYLNEKAIVEEKLKFRYKKQYYNCYG